MEPPHLRVVVAPRPPFIFVFNTSSGQPNYTGLLIDLFHKVVTYNGNSNFTYEIYQSPVDAGGALVDGVWTGVTGELVKGNADVALFPLTRTAARLQVIDCTFSYLDQGLTLLVKSTVEAPGPLSVLAPFTVTLWVTLLCTVIAVALLFWALDLYGRWIRAKQMKALRAAGLLPEKGPSIRGRKAEKRSPIMTSFSAAAGAPERPERISWGGQVLYIVYCFFCLIVLSSYTANLTSFLAVQRANDGIQGLQDVLQQSGLLGVNANGSTATYFASSKDSLAMQMQPFVRYCDTVQDCVSWVRSGRVMAYCSDNGVLEYQAMQRPCDLAVVGDAFGPGNLVVGLQKNSPLLPLFNAALQEFNEDGTLSDLQRAWFDDRSQCNNINGQLNNSRFSVQQMLGAFVFLCLGIVVAFATGTIENLKWCLLRASCNSSSAQSSVRSGRPFSSTETGPRAPPSLSRHGKFGRLSLTLLGLNKASGTSRGDSAPTSPIAGGGGGAFCAHCGSQREGSRAAAPWVGPKEGSAALGGPAALGGEVGSQGYAGGASNVGGGAAGGGPSPGHSPFFTAAATTSGCNGPYDTIGGNGSPADDAAVVACRTPLSAAGMGLGRDGGAATAAAGGASDPVAVTSQIGYVAGGAAAVDDLQGPATREAVPQPLYGTAYDVRLTSQPAPVKAEGVMAGLQGVGGPHRGPWGSGAHEGAARSASSLSEVSPTAATGTPPPPPPPPLPMTSIAGATGSAQAVEAPPMGSGLDGGVYGGLAPGMSYGTVPGAFERELLPTTTAAAAPPGSSARESPLLHSDIPSGLLYGRPWQVYGSQQPVAGSSPPPPPPRLPSTGHLPSALKPPAAAVALTAAATAVPAPVAPPVMPMPEPATSNAQRPSSSAEPWARPQSGGTSRRRLPDAMPYNPSYTHQTGATAARPPSPPPLSPRGEAAAPQEVQGGGGGGSGGAAAVHSTLVRQQVAAGPLGWGSPGATDSGDRHLGWQGTQAESGARSLRFRSKWSEFTGQAPPPPPGHPPAPAAAATLPFAMAAAAEDLPTDPLLPQ